MSAALRVLSAGVLTTVEDQGRHASRRYGVPLGGAMDLFALEAANRLVGNAPGAAALEITGGGATFEVLSLTLLALAGAEFGAQLDEQALPSWGAFLARPGAQLHLRGRQERWGARAYLALAGGIDVPEVLGGRGTCLAGAFGGLTGRPLRTGDTLHNAANGAWGTGDALRWAGRRWPEEQRPAYAETPILRLLPGPHIELFAADALQTLLHTPLRISATSNRIGYRLEGLRLHTVAPVDLPSLGVLPGVIQVPPDGAPILLMADAQTTGGYPIIGVVIGADLPLAAQLLPGDSLRFTQTSLEEAWAARRTLRAWLDAGAEDDDTLALLAWAGVGGELCED